MGSSLQLSSCSTPPFSPAASDTSPKGLPRASRKLIRPGFCKRPPSSSRLTPFSEPSRCHWRDWPWLPCFASQSTSRGRRNHLPDLSTGPQCSRRKICSSGSPNPKTVLHHASNWEVWAATWVVALHSSWQRLGFWTAGWGREADGGSCQGTPSTRLLDHEHLHWQPGWLFKWQLWETNNWTNIIITFLCKNLMAAVRSMLVTYSPLVGSSLFRARMRWSYPFRDPKSICCFAKEVLIVKAAMFSSWQSIHNWAMCSNSLSLF